MKYTKQVSVLICIFIVSLLIGCGGGGGGESSTAGTGTLSVALTDSSCGSYAAIYVTIDEVQVNKSANGKNYCQFKFRRY